MQSFHSELSIGFLEFLGSLGLWPFISCWHVTKVTFQIFHCGSSHFSPLCAVLDKRSSAKVCFNPELDQFGNKAIQIDHM